MLDDRLCFSLCTLEGHLCMNLCRVRKNVLLLPGSRAYRIPLSLSCAKGHVAVSVAVIPKFVDEPRPAD